MAGKHEIAPGEYDLFYNERNYDTDQKRKQLFHDIFYRRASECRAMENADLEAGSDMDYLRMRRREKTAFRYYDLLKDDIEEVCPSVKGLYYSEEEWAFLQAENVTSYDWNSAHYVILAAAAIWILDTIKNSGGYFKLAQVLADVPYEKAGKEFRFLFGHPLFENTDISLVCYALAHRNDDCKGYQKRSSKSLEEGGFRRLWADDLTVKGKNKQDVPSRKTYEAMISLIPEEDLDKIRSDFRSSWMDLAKRYFRCRKVLVDRQIKIDEEYRRFEKFADQTDLQVESALKSLGTAANTVNRNVLEEKMRKALERRDAAAEKEDIVFHKKHDLSDDIDTLRSCFSEMPFISDELFADTYDPGMKEIMQDFYVDDPYGMLAAALIMLDDGDDLMWLYGISVPLFEISFNELPWVNVTFESDASIQNMTPGRQDTYRCRYESKMLGEEAWKLNIAQLVYQQTKAVLPRNLHRYQPGEKYLEDYGLDQKEIAGLQALLSMSGDQAERIFSMLDIMDVFNSGEGEEEKETDETPQIDISQLKKEISELKHRNHTLEQKLQKMNLEAEENKRSQAEEQKELTSLREAVFALHQEEEESPEETIAFPYEVKKKTLVFGGHPSFISGMQKLLTGKITFIDTNKGFTASIIKDADVIFLQTNAMSHSAYYRIMHEARRCENHLEYFVAAGLKSCAGQVIKADQA